MPAPTSNDRAAKLAGGIAITHPERVVYPDVGLTKGEVADYYAAMAPWMLPHVVRRPLSVVRAPSGMAGQRFYQKHARETLKGAVKSVPIRESDGEIAQYVAIDDAKGPSACAVRTLEVDRRGDRRGRPRAPDRFTSI